ncbi:MAG: phosphoglycerate kinase [Candidatus Paceibacterota bacterium]
MNNLRNADVRGKRVLVRCDLNAPIGEEGNVEADYKIQKIVPTIQYLRDNGAKIILLSHFGRPKGKKDPASSLRPIAKRVWELVGGSVKFLNDTIGKAVEKEINAMKEGEIIVLENVRFYAGDEANDDKFARELARLGDIFVEDGFGVCHRAHASVVGITKYIPSYPGLLLDEELRVLSNALISPERPLVSVIGGSKIETKVKVIERLLDKSDYVLLGGKVANSILVAKGICVRDSINEEEEGLMELAKKIDLTSPKLQLPVDGIMGLINFDEEYSRTGAVGTLRREEAIYDIGPETIEKYKSVLSEAKTIIWNGPLGWFEKQPYDKGTVDIAKMIGQINSQVLSVVGGGETVQIIQRLGIENQFDHVSTGGGAMLDFMAGKDLPGIAALEENSKRKNNED